MDTGSTGRCNGLSSFLSFVVVSPLMVDTEGKAWLNFSERCRLHRVGSSRHQLRVMGSDVQTTARPPRLNAKAQRTSKDTTAASGDATGSTPSATVSKGGAIEITLFL